MKKTIVIVSALSLGLVLTAMSGSLESVSAQSNQSSAAGGQGASGQQDTEGFGSAQELQGLTGNETILNNTDIGSPTTGISGLEKEQTTDTEGQMTQGDQSAYDAQQGQGVQQQK